MQNAQISEPKVFGLTGGICCGKSTASKLIAKARIPIIDADQVARDVVVPDSVGLYQLVEVFGDQILQNDELNRGLLASIVFSDKEKMKILNEIMRPLMDSHLSFLISMYKKSGVKLICWDAALIVESGNQDKYRPLIVVSCSPEVQLQRLMKRNSLSEEEAMLRINAQLPGKEKEKFADYVVDTNGTLEDSEKQVLEIIKKLKEEN